MVTTKIALVVLLFLISSLGIAGELSGSSTGGNKHSSPDHVQMC